MHVHCADCDQTFLLSPDGATQSVACPHCGGQRLERDQPSPTHSDGDLRDMVDPGLGLDQGGNPNQEGVWATTDNGWKGWRQRDEAFASVQHHAWDMGDMNFDFGNKNSTHKFVVDENGQVYSLPEPTTHEAVADAHGLTRSGNFPHGYSLGELYDNGETGWFQHETQHSPEAMSSMLYGHFGQPVVIDPNLRPTTNEERWGITPGQEMRGLGEQFDTTGVGPELQTGYGPPRTRRTLRPTPYDREGLIRGGSYDRTLPQDPYLPWTHEADVQPEPETSAVVQPGEHGIHNGTLKWLGFLDAKVDGRAPRLEHAAMYQDYGMPTGHKWQQPVTVTVHHASHLPSAIDLIQTSADRPTDTLRQAAIAMQSGEVPPPPGVDPSRFRFGAEFGGGPQHTAEVTPGAHGIHAGTTKWLGFLDAHVDGIPVRGNENQIFRDYGMPTGARWQQPVTVAVHHPDHLPGAVETIATSAQGSKPAPALREVALGISQGAIPPPPGIDPSKLRFGSVKIAGPLAAVPLIGEGLAAGASELGVSGAVGALMGGALRGIGNNMTRNDSGGAAGQPSPGASVPAPPRDPSMLASVTADLETPHGNPGYYHDDPEAIDQHEFNDGDSDPNQNNPNLEDSGASGEDNVPGGIGPNQPGFAPGSAGLERVNLLAPLLLHYYHSDESGANDPLIRELHAQLEKENPGYLDQADDDSLRQLLHHLRQPDKVHAKVANPVIQQPTMTGPTQLVHQQQTLNAPQQQAVHQGVCPYCGGTTTADGSCPQCGAKTNPMGGATPGLAPGGMAAQPQQPGLMPYTGASHQGPVTDEQKSAVAELLIEENRADEIPVMLQQPWDYAREMAAVANRLNQPPNVDPNDPTPPQPPQEIAPPGATMPVPNPADPSQQMAAAVKRIATPNSATPRCPKCNSATTGFIHDGVGTVSGECHACGNVWKLDNVTPAKVAGPNTENIPAADHQHRNDDLGDTDSSHTWQDTGGHPLVEGGEYEMKSPGYAIPDYIRVEKIKPDGIVVSMIGEYSNADPNGTDPNSPKPRYQHEISKEEVDLQQLTFEPSDGDSDAGEQNLDEYANSNQAPVFTEPQPAPSPEVRASNYEDLPEDMCPRCANEHVSSELSSPTTSYHECYRCGHAWETKEEDFVDENTANRSWIMESSGPGGDDFFSEMERHKAMRESGQAGTRNIADIARRDTRLQAIHEHLEAAAQERTAGKKFTPREKRELIDERGNARNADKLDLSGTHYETRYVDRGRGQMADGENAPLEHMFLGL